MAKAKIRTRAGTTVNIEGTPEEIGEVLSIIRKKEQTEILRRGKREKGKVNATDFILRLKEEGFFDKPKTIIDVKNKLAENALIYPVTTLSGILIGLVKRRELGRIKIEKLWSYVKR